VGLPPSPRGGRRGELRAYDLVSSHHARGACEVIGFGSKCELGTINTPEWNLSVFSKPVGGTREARPTGFPPFFPTNLERRLRRRALFFRQEAGAKSEIILSHNICFGYKKNFCYNEFVTNPQSCLF